MANSDSVIALQSASSKKMKSQPGEQGEPIYISASLWRVFAGLLICVALGLRLWSAFGGEVVHPIRGDAVQYYAYAWNLIHTESFSRSRPDAAVVVSDSYRDPGYPVLLAAFLRTGGDNGAWYHALLVFQALLGTASMAITLAIARRWLSRGPALAVGALVAVWPHLVAISGYVLSETLFGFMLLLSMWRLCRAQDGRTTPQWFGCGLAFGAAAMVNATLTLFAPLLAAFMLLHGDTPRRLTVSFLFGALLLPLAWHIRGINLPDAASDSAADRAVQVMVQGSWPEYHAAFTGILNHDPQAVAIMDQIDRETLLAQHSPRAWFKVASDRVAQEPFRYALWYAWKPALLWAWSIRIGWGDIYPFPTDHPIYLTQPLMRLSESLCVALNPLLFVLMAAAVIAVLIRYPGKRVQPAQFAIALLILYETAVYSLLQSEPRYSIPLRPFEMLMAVGAAGFLWQALRTRLAAGGASQSRTGTALERD